MFRPTAQLAARRFSRGTSYICRSACFRLSMLALLTCLALPVPSARAITITFDYDERDRPSYDPNGTELKRITRAAADMWESYILDTRSFHFDLSWENLPGGSWGQHEDYLGWATNNILIDTKDSSGNDRNWFFDPTPFVNEEYTMMQQTLVRDFHPTTIDNAFNGTPPSLLEIGYNGFAKSGSSAAGKLDLFSVVLHEMGHLLGMSYMFRDDTYNFNPATVGGANVSVNSEGDYEIALESVLMTDWNVAGSERRLPSATDILATWDASKKVVSTGNNQWTLIHFQNYNLPRIDFIGAQSNSWDQTLNWIGGKVPNYENEVFIRHGGSVTQSASLSTAKALTISESSSLFVQGTKLLVLGDTHIGDYWVEQGELHVGKIGGGFSTFQTDNLYLHRGLINTITSEGVVDVDRDFTIDEDAMLMGAGTVRVGNTLSNNGHINGGTFLLFGFGGTLTIGGPKLDLDGDGEQGQISAVSGNLAFYGALTDDFNGTATVGATRTMSFSKPWKMMGDLNMRGGTIASQMATLSGADVTIGGNVHVQGHSIITAPMILDSPAFVNLPKVADILTLAGPTTLRGGTFEGLGTLAIQAVTQVAMPNPVVGDLPPIYEAAMFMSYPSGDSYSTESYLLETSPETSYSTTSLIGINNPSTFGINVPVQIKSGGVLTASVSSLYLPKLTTMSGGQLTGTKTVNQVGNLVVDQNSTINPSTYLWGVDAASHRTTLRAGKRLDLTPGSIARGGEPQRYKGYIKLEQNSTLHVDLGLYSSWTLGGTLELNPGSRVTGDQLVNAGHIFGSGTLSMSKVVNDGTLSPGNSSPGNPIGEISIPNGQFVQTSSGSLNIQLAGYTQGTTYDVLRTNTAQLGGTLRLGLADGFLPEVGSQFDIFTASDRYWMLGSAIKGTFDSFTIKAPEGIDLSGELLYFPNRVSFRVTELGITNGYADFNDDGTVDGSDLRIWEKVYGMSTDSSRVSADANGDNITDGFDFLAWQRASTRSSNDFARSAIVAIPEPSAVLLTLLGSLGAMFTRRLR